MDMIYYTIDSRIEYCKLLYLSINSLRNSGYKGDIGIICNQEFKHIVSQHLDNIKYFVYDGDGRSIHKLRLFEFDVSSYDRFLFLDADTLITRNISILFDLIDDEICVASAGHLFSEEDAMWYGSYLMTEEEKIEFQHLESINSGVFGFRKDQIQTLKEIYNSTLKDNLSSHYCEQPCFNAHLMRNKGYSYSYNGLVCHGPAKFVPGAIVYHFAGGVGNFEGKIDYMISYYESTKEQSLKEQSMIVHKTRIDSLNYLKTILPDKPVTCEIGFFKGEFSQDISRILESSKHIVVDIFSDTNIQSADKDGNNPTHQDMTLMEEYSNSLGFTTIKGTSYDLSSQDAIDFIYIDADHNYDWVMKDLENARLIISKNGIIGGHDYTNEKFPGCYQAVNDFCNKYELEISFITLDGCPSYFIKMSC